MKLSYRHWFDRFLILLDLWKLTSSRNKTVNIFPNNMYARRKSRNGVFSRLLFSKCTLFDKLILFVFVRWSLNRYICDVVCFIKHCKFCEKEASKHTILNEYFSKCGHELKKQDLKCSLILFIYGFFYYHMTNSNRV